MYRDRYCSSVTEDLEGKKVLLSGWVHSRRDLGQLTFLDLRDRSGLIQVFFQVESFPFLKDVRLEWVLSIEGVVRKRPQPNPDLSTGAVEVEILKAKILSKSESLPVDYRLSTTSEKSLLEYRYLALRDTKLQENLRTRHNACVAIREFLNENDFLEIETPVLYKSTPEGARDFLVPSRVHPGEFYALPQSPQTLKQLLMIGGCDRYYQVAKCFRDEDLRSDRQPEFTQVDIELSFITLPEVCSLMTRMIQKVWKDVRGVSIKEISTISYDEAMLFYGVDNPDLRIPWKIKCVSDYFEKSDVRIFKTAINQGGVVRSLFVPFEFSRSQIDKFTKLAKAEGAKGLAWVKRSENLESPLSKFLSEEDQSYLCPERGTTFIVADSKKVASAVLGSLRSLIGEQKLDLANQEDCFVWVTQFPLFEYDEEEGRYFSVHHPFTLPEGEEAERALLLDSKNDDLLSLRSATYDLVCNGMEVGGGGLRIYQPDLQSKIFSLLSMSDEDIKSRFGFFIDALKYGTPPHGGIAFGLDRLAMILSGESSIRSVIAFPKTARATCLMSSAPSQVDPDQIKDLGLKLDLEELATVENKPCS